MRLILPAFITVLALLLYVGVSGNVLRARQRSGLRAPAVIGAVDFERAFRVQQNTLEQLVLFLPTLWLFSFFVSPLWGAAIGLVWIIGRILYAVSYVRDPESRLTGFAIGLASALILLIGALAGVVRALWLTGLV